MFEGESAQYGPDATNVSDHSLAMPSSVLLPAGARAMFQHIPDFEYTFDGGVVEYSTNGGATWLDATGLTDGGLQPDGILALSDEAVMAPDQVALPDDEGAWIGVGTGFGAADGVLAQRLASRFSAIDATALPHAADVARLAARAYALGEAVPADQVEPAYLRHNVALTLEQQRALRAGR